MVLAKKHMALDIWISPEHWRDAMAKLKHYRDMEYINSGHDISGQPEAFKSWVWQYQLPELVQKDSAVKNQIQKLKYGFKLVYTEMKVLALRGCYT